MPSRFLALAASLAVALAWGTRAHTQAGAAAAAEATVVGATACASCHQGMHDTWTSGRHAATSWTDGAFMHFALYESKDGSSTRRAQIAFRVRDVNAAHQRAVEAGAEVVHGPKRQPWGTSARYRDADGNVIELTEHG